jgi:hypothetical protein
MFHVFILYQGQVIGRRNSVRVGKVSAAPHLSWKLHVFQVTALNPTAHHLHGGLSVVASRTYQNKAALVCIGISTS